MKCRGCTLRTTKVEDREIIFAYNYKVEVGKVIWFRYKREYDWHLGKITQVNPGSYFFVDILDSPSSLPVDPTVVGATKAELS